MKADCYKINDKTYLKGDYSTEENAFEYFDITTEIETGHSWSFYSNDTFKKANESECNQVENYLKRLTN